MSTSPDQIVLTPDQREHLARIADQTGRPWHEVLAQALATIDQANGSQVADGESVYDALVRLRLLGCVKDGPPDLSTNANYMEGFGERGE